MRQHNYSKLEITKPILAYMTNEFTEIFIPGKEQSIDEAMIPFKGCSSIQRKDMSPLSSCFLTIFTEVVLLDLLIKNSYACEAVKLDS